MGSNHHVQYRVGLADLEQVFGQLTTEGYQNIGPAIRDGAIDLIKLPDWNSIAQGATETIAAGSYHLHQHKTNTLFQYTVGPRSFKKFLYPPKRKLWSAQKSGQSITFESNEEPPPKMAFWGVRGCDLASLNILDRVFMKTDYANPWYQTAREQLFVIAAACTTVSPNCFCSSMGTGPLPEKGYDLLLTEVVKDDHFFLLSAGSEKGKKMLDRFSFTIASSSEEERAKTAVETARKEMPIRFKPQDAANVLKESRESSHWEEVANRCLSCANCTMVCPTCFCSTIEDLTNLTGDHTSRWLRWDSCFTSDFSFIHGGSIRPTTQSRYRQWMTHKLSSWYDQFGTSGCVGCGRCITWCPVGIDLTEELLALKQAANNNQPKVL